MKRPAKPSPQRTLPGLPTPAAVRDDAPVTLPMREVSGSTPSEKPLGEASNG